MAHTVFKTKKGLLAPEERMGLKLIRKTMGLLNSWVIIIKFKTENSRQFKVINNHRCSLTLVEAGPWEDSTHLIRGIQ